MPVLDTHIRHDMSEHVKIIEVIRVINLDL